MDILSGEEASSLRQFFLCTFVDTSCDYFQARIAHMRQFSDGLRYTGYLWDCMLDREPVSCHYLISQLQALTGQFYVLGHPFLRQDFYSELLEISDRRCSARCA